MTADLGTVMAGLAAGEASQLAWAILEVGVDIFMTVSHEPVSRLIRMLARGGGDPPIEAGESAVAGLAGCSAAREVLGPGPDSRIRVFGTEGATDSELYQRFLASESTGS